LEQRILESVSSTLPLAALTIWEQQIQAIYLVQRLPDGVEVNFYMRDPLDRTRRALPRFPDRNEFVIATVVISLPTLGTSIDANVWCVSGRLFSIEYKGSIKYFDEAIGMDPIPDVEVAVTLKRDASA
jgi:hypothetical protein